MAERALDLAGARGEERGLRETGPDQLLPVVAEVPGEEADLRGKRAGAVFQQAPRRPGR